MLGVENARTASVQFLGDGVGRQEAVAHAGDAPQVSQPFSRTTKASRITVASGLPRTPAGGWSAAATIAQGCGANGSVTVSRSAGGRTILPNTLHASFPGVSQRALLGELVDVVAASVGSACHSEHDAVSGVLAVMGANAVRAADAARLSVGRGTTLEEVERAAEALACAWQQLHTR